MGSWQEQKYQIAVQTTDLWVLRTASRIPLFSRSSARVLRGARDGRRAHAASAFAEPTEVVTRVREQLEARGPIIQWALDLWIRSYREEEDAVEDERGNPLARWAWRQYDRVNVPRIVSSLRVLELELASQVKFGLTHSPLRVLALAWSAIAVTVFALVAQVPGFEKLKCARLSTHEGVWGGEGEGGVDVGV